MIKARTVQHAGGGAASPAVAAAAEALLDGYQGALYVLTGLRVIDAATGQWMTLDLVALTDTAVVVGVEVRPGAANSTPPQAGALGVARLQRDRLIAPPLPVYAFWLGAAPPAGYAGAAPALGDPQAVRRFVEQASAQGVPPAPEASARLAEQLLQANLAPVDLPGGASALGAGAAPAPGLPLAGLWHWLGQLAARLDSALRERILQPLARRRREIRPADVRERLEAAMLARENVLEDARYHRVVPNDYVVSLNPADYERHYRLIARRVCEQWQEKLIEALNTANQRRGRNQYQFGGPVRVRVQPDAAVLEGQVRIQSRIDAEPEQAASVACLELLSTGRRWSLPGGVVTIGRAEEADIYLPAAAGERQPLISSHHAYLTTEDGAPRLFDGSPSGRPSLNGTFVNGRRVAPGGHVLADGDVIVLAPLDPEHPRPDAPGAVALHFYGRCPA